MYLKEFVRFDKKKKKFMVKGEKLNFSLKMFEAPIELYYKQYYSFENFIIARMLMLTHLKLEIIRKLYRTEQKEIYHPFSAFKWKFVPSLKSI